MSCICANDKVENSLPSWAAWDETSSILIERGFKNMSLQLKKMSRREFQQGFVALLPRREQIPGN